MTLPDVPAEPTPDVPLLTVRTIQAHIGAALSGEGEAGTVTPPSNVHVCSRE